MDTATLLRDTFTLDDCPVLDGDARSTFDEAERAAKRLTKEIGVFLEDRSPEERIAWLKTSLVGSRVLFQPWMMEILYVIAMDGKARFNEMHGLLGMSSRTLSDKLKLLEQEGLVERTVFDERPVRVEYSLTKLGWSLAALATPLFTRFNLTQFGLD